MPRGWKENQNKHARCNNDEPEPFSNFSCQYFIVNFHHLRHQDGAGLIVYIEHSSFKTQVSKNDTKTFPKQPTSAMFKILSFWKFPTKWRVISSMGRCFPKRLELDTAKTFRSYAAKLATHSMLRHKAYMSSEPQNSELLEPSKVES